MAALKNKQYPLNPGEVIFLRQTTEHLTLFGIINALSKGTRVGPLLFKEILDDALKLTQIKNQNGTSAIEYALLVAGIAVACLVAVGLLGQTLHQMFRAAADLFRPF
jgi:Flp pilus assembly pilin Flp